MELHLPWPPSVNSYWRSNRGRVHISQKGREYRQAIIWKAKQEKWPKFKGPVQVQLDLFPPDRRKRDPDNILKCLFDALQHAGVVDDDANIKKGCWDVKWPLQPDGSVRIVVEKRGVDT